MDMMPRGVQPAALGFGTSRYKQSAAVTVCPAASPSSMFDGIQRDRALVGIRGFRQEAHSY